MSLNRNAAPAFKVIDRIQVQQAKTQQLSNGVKVYTLSAGSQEITRLELVFEAGMFYQPAALVASSTNSLLESGTRSYSADDLSGGIDFYGSFLELETGQDFAAVSLFSLNKYLEPSIKFIEELIKWPTFPEHEFKIHIGNKRQKYAINSQKVNVLARRRFAEILFGDSHPYGVEVKDGDFERLSLNELKEFFKKHYQPANCSIFASGCLPEGLMDMLEKYFGGAWHSEAGISPQPLASLIQPSTQQKHFLHRPDAIQSAIRVGRVLFNKTHPDYFKFQVLNTILGGYFGSRLMANIREDKGYTYGIGSGITNMVKAGYFYISTEVGADVTNQTLEEIYKEIKLLREELVDAHELETVRNYILGQFLRSVDGPFALGDKFKAIWEYGLDYGYYERYFDAVKKVSPADLRDLANQYLQEKDLLECVAGKM